LAVEALASIKAASTKRELSRQLNQAIDGVAATLVNTRSVCRSSYIHPAVFEDFEAGSLSDVLKLRTRSTRLLDWMDLDEIRVLKWLGKRSAVPCQTSLLPDMSMVTAEGTNDPGSS
jgi:DNA topoisomerase-1